MGAPATVGKYNHVFQANMWIAHRDSNGYAMGTLTTPNSPVNGTVYSSYLISKVVDVTPAADTIPIIRFVGSGRQFATTRAGVTQYGDVTFTLTGYDEQLEAYLNKSSVDTSTNTAATITATNPNQKTWASFLVGFNIKVHNEDTGTDEFVTLIYPNAIISRNQEGGAGQVTGDAVNPNNLTFTLTPSISTRGATGELYTGYALNLSGGVTYLEKWRTAYPLHLATYIDDNSAGTFTLPYRPINTDATGAGQNAITTDGVVSTVTSVNTSTAVVTRTATGAADIVQVLYQTDYVAP